MLVSVMSNLANKENDYKIIKIFEQKLKLFKKTYNRTYPHITFYHKIKEYDMGIDYFHALAIHYLLSSLLTYCIIFS
jgi:hypothetical protein